MAAFTRRAIERVRGRGDIRYRSGERRDHDLWCVSASGDTRGFRSSTANLVLTSPLSPPYFSSDVLPVQIFSFDTRNNPRRVLSSLRLLRGFSKRRSPRTASVSKIFFCSRCSKVISPSLEALCTNSFEMLSKYTYHNVQVH